MKQRNTGYDFFVRLRQAFVLFIVLFIVTGTCVAWGVKTTFAHSWRGSGSIAWGPDRLQIKGVAGTQSDVSVTFSSTTALDETRLYVEGDASRLVSLVANYKGSVVPKTDYSLVLRVNIPARTQTRTYKGFVKLSADSSRISML